MVRNTKTPRKSSKNTENIDDFFENSDFLQDDIGGNFISAIGPQVVFGEVVRVIDGFYNGFIGTLIDRKVKYTKLGKQRIETIHYKIAVPSEIKVIEVLSHEIEKHDAKKNHEKTTEFSEKSGTK